MTRGNGKKKAKSRPSSRSIMNDAGLQPLQPLFAVLYCPRLRPNPNIRILQLQIPPKNHKAKVNLNDYVASFNLKELTGIPSKWIFSPPTSSTSVMYVMPDRDFLGQSADKPLHGYEFNITTGECRYIKPVTGTKVRGQPVNCQGRIYIMEHLDHYHPKPHPTFECYDPDNSKWEALNPFPIDATGLDIGDIGPIQAIAVWGDTILHNLDGREFWAYNVTRNKWSRVQATDNEMYQVTNEDNEVVEINRCCTIYGRAIVLGNSIYALTTLSDTLVLELSIESSENDDGLVYICALSSNISVSGLKLNHLTYMERRLLVHLGNDDFCLVQSSYSHDDLKFQPIYLTNLKLNELDSGGKSMTVTSRHTYYVEIERWNQFELALCFSLPMCQTMFEAKQGQTFNFNFDVEAEGLKPALSHYIYVRNLPPEATEEELEKKLKKFGPITTDGIRLNRNETGMYSARVQFESATSKERAIEASTIRYRGYCAMIEEKTI